MSDASIESLSSKADQLIRLVTDLDKRLGDSNTALKVLQESDQRTRKFIRIASGSLAGIFLLFIAVGVLALSAKHTGDDAQRALREGCEVGNEARRNQIVLWDYIITISPPATAEDQTRIDNLKAFIKVTFAPRDCSSL